MRKIIVMIMAIITIILSILDIIIVNNKKNDHKSPEFSIAEVAGDKGVNHMTYKYRRSERKLIISNWFRYISKFGKVFKEKRRQQRKEIYCRDWAEAFCTRLVQIEKNVDYKKCFVSNYHMCLKFYM